MKILLLAWRGPDAWEFVARRSPNGLLLYEYSLHYRISSFDIACLYVRCIAPFCWDAQKLCSHHFNSTSLYPSSNCSSLYFCIIIACGLLVFLDVLDCCIAKNSQSVLCALQNHLTSILFGMMSQVFIKPMPEFLLNYDFWQNFAPMKSYPSLPVASCFLMPS